MLGEDVRGEAEEVDSGLAPRVRGETRLAAGVGEEGLAVPAVLHRDLRQQDAAPAPVADEEAVPSHLDVLGADRLERAEGGDLDRQPRELRLPEAVAAAGVPGPRTGSGCGASADGMNAPRTILNKLWLSS